MESEALALLRDWMAALDGPEHTPALRMSRDSILRHIEQRARALLAAADAAGPGEAYQVPYISEVKLAKAAASISDATGADSVTLPMEVAQALLRVATELREVPSGTDTPTEPEVTR